MRQHGPGPERADRFQRLDDPHAGEFARGDVLGGVLDGVDLEGGAVLLGETEGGLDRLEGCGVEGVRGNRRDDRGVIPVPLHELGGVRQRGFRAWEVRRREADDVGPGYGTDARVNGGAGHVVAEVVHVGEGGGPPLQHLDRGEQGPPVDEIGSDERGLGGKDVVVEPRHEREIVGEAAQQRHGGVAVRVDQAGDDQMAGGVYDASGVGAGFARGDQGRDAVAFDQNRAALEDGPGLVHDHHGAAVDEQGTVVPGGRGGVAAGGGQEKGQ